MLGRATAPALGVFLLGSIAWLGFVGPKQPGIASQQRAVVGLRAQQPVAHAKRDAKERFPHDYLSLNDSVRRFAFDFDRDTFIHMHIPKTGGTFFYASIARVAVTGGEQCHPRTSAKSMADLLVPAKDQHVILTNKALNQFGFRPNGILCPRPSNAKQHWFLTRPTVGWQCGVHASLERLEQCIARLDAADELGNGHHFVITMLRRPVDRFLSEFLMKHGDGWSLRNDGLDRRSIAIRATVPSDSYCGETVFRSRAVPCKAHMPNFDSEAPASVALKYLPDFLRCRDNPGVNRQVRMLAAGRPCVPHDTKTMFIVDESDLELAKAALLRLEYFGLIEFFRQSEQLFEWTFGVLFAGGWAPKHESKAGGVDLDASLLQQVRHLNELEIGLYRYAVQLFRVRVSQCDICDPITDEDVASVLAHL